MTTPTNSADQADLADPAAQEVTSLITCCKLTLRDGTVMGFTSDTEARIIDGVMYKATTMLALSSIMTTDDLSVDNLDIAGVLDNVDVKEHDILAGRYDFAEIEVFTAHLEDIILDDETKCAKRIIQQRGWLGEVSVHDEEFTAEVRGLSQKLQCHISELCSPTCRATFGDGRCGAKIENYTHEGVVDTADTRQTFTAKNMNKPDGYFAFGKVTWLTGYNAGLRMEIKEFTNINDANAQFALALAMPQPIRSGDKFAAVAGCDKVFATCCQRFNNAINFRGEPHVPGRMKLGEAPEISTW